MFRYKVITRQELDNMDYRKSEELKSLFAGASLGLGGYLDGEYIRWKNGIEFSGSENGDLVIEYDKP